MRPFSSPGSAKRSTVMPLWLLTLCSSTMVSHALSFDSVPDANLDVSELGQMGFAGQFSGISFYEYDAQQEQAFSSNGSSQLMASLPNSVMANLVAADASIKSMCVFQGMVILGGNFTSLGGKKSTAVAAFNPNTTDITPLDGVSGQVNSLLCDDEAGMVYVGGNFQAADSLNAITWLKSSNWASLPFAGFNGAVSSITKAPSGHIIFGGSFTGLGNATTTTSTNSTDEPQTINLGSANISTYQTSSTDGFNDPKNIICNTDGSGGAGKTWLLEDGVPGNWAAEFGFGFRPRILRLRNTFQDGRGTKTWSFTARPNNGLMNFTYIDPATGKNMSCSNACPLSDDNSVEYQDFEFVNGIGMNAFRLDISAWYGQGGGLNGIQLFSEDVYSYAVNAFNEPGCSNSSTPSSSETTGSWSVTPAGRSSADYLTAVLSSPITADAATVTFFPDIRESGDYLVVLYTPGCQQDDTCSRRGQVNVTGTLNSTSGIQVLNSGQTTYQTNEFDKFEQVYTGNFEASSSGFRPSITLSPVAGQALSSDDLVMVAQKVSFVKMNTSTSGLNGLFEYDPTKSTIDTSDINASAFTKVAKSFKAHSVVRSLVASDSQTYIGGNFTTSSLNNVVSLDKDGQTSTLAGGLNGDVLSMYLSDGQLFVGGAFNNTQKAEATGLSNVAVYDELGSSWAALGAGVDGTVNNVVPMTLNLTGNATEVVTLSGTFSHILAFANHTAIDVDGFAVWVKSQNNWLQNLDIPVPLFDGHLTTSLLDTSDGTALYAGSISSQALSANGVVSTDGTLGNFPIKLTSSSTSSSTGVSKRASIANNTNSISGIVTGAFETNNGQNVTVLAGRFTASATNGSTIHNLAFIDRKNSDTVTGLGTELPTTSTFLALAINGDDVFAGGRLNGTIQESSVNGLISYNIPSASFNTQPPVLAGDDVIVTSIAVRPDSSDVYVAGSFDTAGSLPCPGICVLSTGDNQWSRPGFLDGTVNTMLWSSKSLLFVGGNLTVNDTNLYLASYDVSGDSWTGVADSSALPGPVEAMTAANQDQDHIWVSGTQPDGTVYLMKYDGSWKSPDLSLGKETILNSLQMFTLTDNHDKTDLIDDNEALLLTGSINIPGFGTASGAIYNGTDLIPYLLTASLDGTGDHGSVSKLFVEKQNFFTSSSSGHLAIGFVVLIALAISLGLMLLIVAAGLALDRYRKKRDGYVPAPTSMVDRGHGLQRVPPAELLESLSHGRPGAPHV
ncbi:cellular morphogenesis protein [Xylariaceae sp. FL1272]|nr:cellular morphogenesis protein [Xylariaceae sp. FL1272]